jgi:hypothetical protein
LLRRQRPRTTFKNRNVRVFVACAPTLCFSPRVNVLRARIARLYFLATATLTTARALPVAVALPRREHCVCRRKRFRAHANRACSGINLLTPRTPKLTNRHRTQMARRRGRLWRPLCHVHLPRGRPPPLAAHRALRLLLHVGTFASSCLFVLLFLMVLSGGVLICCLSKVYVVH